ncbi:MAG: TonB-dependent receptor [Acidobacteria bacterium]|nr:TonB-dependent receptor [Acidobacteriota bacterium]MCB9398667.1 TonB-dependent receptor [Acidobacteriota bacterium]
MRRLLIAIVISYWSLLAWSQTTSSILGKTVTQEGDTLPGVVVRIESENMIGQRTDVTRENGEFLFRNIPPGRYQLTAEMPGMQTAKLEVQVGLGQTARPTVTLKPEAVSEVLQVTSAENPILDTNEVVAHFDGAFAEQAAVRRDQENIALLSPGVTGRFDGGNYGGAPSISGAPSSGNTYLVNGTDSRFDNTRSQAADTVIEDAIQETTVMTAGISAEYGQFSGGVIATITKSGGNSFSGSLRSHFSNADWVARNPLELESGVEKEDDINHVETVTFGGPIIKDRLWFFLAGEKTELTRDINFSTARTISDRAATAYGLPTGQYAPGIRKVPGRVDERENFEIKLTGQIFPGHDLIVSYQDREDVNVNNTSSSYDISAAATRTVTREALAINYRANLNSAMNLDVLYTDRDSIFLARPVPEHLQGQDLRIYGTQLYNRTGGARTNSPTFLGKPDEPRGNKTYGAKLSYFGITENWGSHDIVVGLQNSEDSRYADNRQTVNDWQFRSDWRFETDGTAVPIFSPTSADGRYQSRLYYWPIELSSQTYRFEVLSAYVNDNWNLNDNFRFNIGFRFDKNDATDQQGTPVADDSHISPRLSANWDLQGNRKHQFVLSYSEYVQRTSESADDTSQAGSPSLTVLRYRGPQTENYLDVIDWINQTYGEGFFLDPLNHPNRAQWEADLLTNNLYEPGSPIAIIGQINPNGGGIPGSLDSMIAQEIRLGYTRDFNEKGFLKADYIYRNFSNFGVDHINLLTGPTANGSTDLDVINNDDDGYERTYHAVQLQGQYVFTSHLNLSGNYTWSQLRGNVNGEASDGVGSTIGSTTIYPEYNDFDRRNPVGYLPGDVRHQANLFLNYDVTTFLGTFNISLMERITSGSPYDRAWTLDLDEFDGQYGLPSLDAYSYVSPNTTTVYYLTRGEDRAETAYETNLGLNWNVKLFRKAEFFIQIDVFNVFNSSSADNGQGYRSTVNEIAPFNVYTETPIEGVHYELDSQFGTPTASTAFQRPRTFEIDLGFRF